MSDKQSFNIDLEKAKEIATDLHLQDKTNSDLFKNFKPADYEPPQGMIRGSKEHAIYLTYLFALEQDKPDVLWSRAKQLYSESPWFFDAEQILSRSDEGLSKALTGLAVTDLEDSLKRWRMLSKILTENYSGDPRRLADKPPDLSKIQQKIEEILGTSEKRLVNRYLQLMTANKLLKLKDVKNLGILNDKNVTVFTFYTGVLKFEGEFFEGKLDDEPIRSLTRKVWYEAAQSKGIPIWEMEESIQILSSKLCPEKKCIICPVREKCDKRFKIEIDGRRVRITRMKTEQLQPPNFCIYCGRELLKESRFCDGCGSEVTEKWICKMAWPTELSNQDTGDQPRI